MSEKIKQFKDALLVIQDRLEKVLQNSKNQENYIDYLEKEIQQATNNIRLYFQSPNIVPTLNGIVDYLNTISQAGNLLEQSTIDTYLHLNNRINNIINQITNLQIQLGTLQNDYDLLNQAYRAHKLNYHLLKATSIDKKNHISKLLQENFGLLLLNRQTYQQIRECRANKYLLEYNRDRLFERYKK
ncbi:9461_t:CDS:2 [Cetraspora pellucida]|uniref:9461_t:CDS:1 n=1 Tax=Cetraspora pellucida TaxID=1433469 RepID=A0A9N9IN82_9GLOM|nr:9461_t:CDS:2 [Cetraspora pellucida]